MSCHISCATCSGNTYYDLCLSCVSSRILTSSTCPCSSGFYEYENSLCTQQASVSFLDKSLINLSYVAYFIAISIQYFYIILNTNRIISVKIKKIIDTCQIIGLISYYRFLQPILPSQGLKIMNAFNFQYLNTLSCTSTGPRYGCSHFENLFGIFFTAILFVLLFLVSYCLGIFIMNCQSIGDQTIIIRDGRQIKVSQNFSFSFTQYVKTMTPSFLLLYLDQSIIQTTLSLSRLAIVNTLGLLILIPALIFIICIIKHHFRIINHKAQTTLAYRARHSYFYYYDEFYHLNYIDHIFQAENLNNDKETLKIPYYPQSNLIIMQLIFKIFLAASTIVFYQYQPYLFAYCCLFILLAFFFLRKVFYTYQIGDLYFYFGLIIIYSFSISTFYISKFFSYFLIATTFTLEVVALIYFIVILVAWKKEKQGQMFKKVFDRSNEIQNDSSKLNDNSGSGQNSQQQIFTKNQKQTNKNLLQNQSFHQQKNTNILKIVRPYDDKIQSDIKENNENNHNKLLSQQKKKLSQHLSFVSRQKRVSKHSILSFNQIQNHRPEEDKDQIQQIKFKDKNQQKGQPIQDNKVEKKSIPDSIYNKTKKTNEIKMQKNEDIIQQPESIARKKTSQLKSRKDNNKQSIKSFKKLDQKAQISIKEDNKSIKSNIFKNINNQQTQINLI